MMTLDHARQIAMSLFEARPGKESEEYHAWWLGLKRISGAVTEMNRLIDRRAFERLAGNLQPYDGPIVPGMSIVVAPHPDIPDDVVGEWKVVHCRPGLFEVCSPNKFEEKLIDLKWVDRITRNRHGEPVKP
jgi:hypothetical protein